MIYHSPINTLPISLLLSKALLIAKMMSESAFNIKSAFDSKSAFRYHFWMKKCKVGAFGMYLLISVSAAKRAIKGRKAWLVPRSTIHRMCRKHWQNTSLVRYCFTFPLLFALRSARQRVLRSARKAVNERIVFELLQQKC